MPARRRIPLNRSTSGVRAPPAAFSSRRPCPQRADDPSGGRRSDGGKDAEGRVRNGRPTILPRPDGKRPVRPPRIPARRRRNGAPKRSSVTQKHRTSLPADELRIARDIGSADDRLPVLARHAAERLPPRRRSRIPSSGRHETTDGPGSAQSGNIAIFILRNRLCSVQIAARCGIGEVVSPEEALSGKSTGTPAIAARLPHTSARHRHVSTCRPPEGGLPKPAASDRTTIPPVRPRPTVLYRTRRRSRHFCRRASPSATQRTFHPSYRRTRAFDDRQTAPPSFAPSERKSSIREEGTAPPDTVSIRSGALPPSSPSARRFGLRFKQSGKNKSKPPAPYHRRLSRSRPSTHTRPRPVTSNGKQRKQGRPTNLLPPLPENLLFGENTKTVTIEKRLSEIRQTASFRSGSGTTRK